MPHKSCVPLAAVVHTGLFVSAHLIGKKNPCPTGKKTIYYYENTASATTTPIALTHKRNIRDQHSNKAHTKHSRTSMHRERHRSDVSRTEKEKEQKKQTKQ